MPFDQIIPSLFDNYFIKLLFLVHATILFLADVCINASATVTIYTSYNLLFLICILLAIVADRNVDIILLTSIFDGVCMIFDVILIIAGQEKGVAGAIFIFINMILRIFSAILLLKNYAARAGVSDPTGGLLEVHVPVNVSGQARTTYHNIDQPSQSLP